MRLRVRTEFACSQGWGCCAIIIKNSSGFTRLGLLGAHYAPHTSRPHSYPYFQLLLALSSPPSPCISRTFSPVSTSYWLPIFQNSSDQTPSIISTQFFPQIIALSHGTARLFLRKIKYLHSNRVFPHSDLHGGITTSEDHRKVVNHARNTRRPSPFTRAK